VAHPYGQPVVGWPSDLESFSATDAGDSFPDRVPRVIQARSAEYATVTAVPREDLLNWHQRYVHPNNITLGISGYFDPQRMEALAERAGRAEESGPL